MARIPGLNLTTSLPTMSEHSGLPHPFCTTNVLYLLDAPPRVKWENIVATFKQVGRISALGATKTRGKHRTWGIRFESVLHGELTAIQVHLAVSD